VDKWVIVGESGRACYPLGAVRLPNISLPQINIRPANPITPRDLSLTHAPSSLALTLDLA